MRIKVCESVIVIVCESVRMKVRECENESV